MAKDQKSMQALWQDSYLSGGDEYLEELYEAYLKNPQSVDSDWQRYFASLSANASGMRDIPHSEIIEQFAALAKSPQQRFTAPSAVDNEAELRVVELINNYRRVGHLQAQIDPLRLLKPQPNPLLDLASYHFSDAEKNKVYAIGDYLGLGKSSATVNEVYESLRHIYCQAIGFEYMHIDREDEVEWIRARIEKDWANFNPSAAEKKYLLERLVVADGIEKYIGFKYVGQKRFSLEGGDSLIPLLDTIVKRAAAQGVKEAVLGMAHRGRLNVLINVVGKSPQAIFAGFEGKNIPDKISGDVKYHLGYSSAVETENGPLHIALAFNPSHLEIVAPVVQGSVRARQRRRKDTEMQQVLPIQIHGDAAFAGQGVVMETFSLSQTRWFKVGGSIHIVINNQVGFTTSNLQDARSTLYCTDVAKMVAAPILHVNANDPEAVYFAAQFAIDYRHRFKRDVVIDLVCYRRLGHNEADEPSATQPVMYKVIKALPVPYMLYAAQLLQEGVIKEGDEKILADQYRQDLDAGKTMIKTLDLKKSQELLANWEPYQDKHWTEKVKTAVPLEKIKKLAAAMEVLPPEFVVQPQVKKLLDNNKKMTQGELPLNWGYAENMAYATLLTEGYPIRLCGQDAGRGTFAHRHAVLHDQRNDEVYIPLSHLTTDQAQINIIDSLLSEEAVLGFEYGYSTAEPNYLDIWEAQFGDFANGAQVVIDQFISSGEQKWDRLCGLVMLLPHGYEGQGPEHSSARIERYLQLCAQDNMQVCVPTTPAQIFHLLRRQMIRPYRKPLIVISPKSLLRNPAATSSLEDLANGEFQCVIKEVDELTAAKINRVIFCSGKVYYELLEERRANKLTNVAIIRIEQLYPFPEEQVKKVLATYPQAKEIIWCQEEPQNQGAYITMQPYLLALLAKDQVFKYVGRRASASPAVGYHSVHEQEQKELVSQALLK